MSRRTVWKTAILVIVICALGAIYYAASAIYRFASLDPCDTVVRGVTDSPNGMKQVIIFERECGATVGLNTQASLAPTGRTFSPDDTPSFFAVAGRHPLAVSWMSDTIVELGGVPNDSKIYKNKASEDNVSIRYK